MSCHRACYHLGTGNVTITVDCVVISRIFDFFFSFFLTDFLWRHQYKIWPVLDRFCVSSPGYLTYFEQTLHVLRAECLTDLGQTWCVCPRQDIWEVWSRLCAVWWADCFTGFWADFVLCCPQDIWVCGWRGRWHHLRQLVEHGAGGAAGAGVLLAGDQGLETGNTLTFGDSLCVRLI